MEPRIELPKQLADRAAAVRISDEQIQYHYQREVKESSITDDQFVERLTHDVEALEHNAREIAEEQAKQRLIDEAHQRQANRIALAGMALPAVIAAASPSKSVNEIACAALAHADALLAAADATKDPILND